MKLTIQDVFKMFEPFGIPAQEVADYLNASKDKTQAFNVFEGLKARVQLRWKEMVEGEASLAEVQALRQTYERLMKISLKNYSPPAPPPPKKPPPKDGSDFMDSLLKGDVDGAMKAAGDVQDRVARKRMDIFGKHFRDAMNENKGKD